jgi:fructoselysine-6-P-deglycase FrlB-like protein
LESLTREGKLEACTCGSAREVVHGYLELRRDKLLQSAFVNERSLKEDLARELNSRERSIGD